MKRLTILTLSIFLVISLCACSGKEEQTNTTYIANRNGTSYVVDPVNGTISDGTYTYQYELSGTSSGYSINITYPNGSTYWWNAQNNGGFGGWSDDYDEDLYTDGGVLCDIIEVGVPREKESKNGFLIFLLLVIGVFNTAAPQAAWQLEYGWRYKNAEPSDLALGLNRIGGIIAVIAAVIMLIA